MALTRSLAAVAALAFAQHVQAWNPVLPTCLSPFKPFVYSGCFDDTSGETLEWRTLLDQTNMTVESCQAFCKGNEYRYAGLENGNVCYCGETVNSNIQLPDSYCNATCAGNSSETCGQFNVIEIFSDTTFPKVNESTIADYVSIGCWSDNPDNKRTLYHQITSLASDDTAGCLNGCKDLGFPYAGLEYGGECWCGVVLANNATQIADSSCNMNCPNTNEICGGSNALSLYVAYDMESLEPCGYTTSSSSVPVISTTSSSSSSATSPVTPTTSSTTAKVTPTTTSTSCPVSPKTTTTTKPTTAPPATTSKTTTSSAPLCTETIWTPSPCEYGCGSWCNKNIPEWDEGTGCGSGYAACKIQVSACFKNAGFPGVIDCWSYAEWCSSISSYCSSTCKNGVKGSCSKKDCIGRSPPKGGKPPTSTTTVVPCKPTTTSMPAPPKTTTSSKTSCIPSPTPICTQPSNPWYGYGPGKPVGGIDMPVLTCNDIKSDWQNNPFKLYTDSNSSKCGSYPRPSVPNACKDACKAQYDNCNSGYAQGCKSYWKKRNFFEYTATGENSPEKRGLSWWGGNIFGGDSYQSATNKCQQQYQDCLNANKNSNHGGKCSSFGSGW